MIPSTTPQDVFEEHLYRYIFASRFANKKCVLDIRAEQATVALFYVPTYAWLPHSEE